MMVVCAIVLFLYSDLCLATCINFVFHANGETLTIGPALAFSVVICAINAYEAGAYLIAFCIGFMSIIWPFIKLLLLLFAWQAPTSCMSPGARGCLLRFLDGYGKWSLIDTWLGILALACYRLGWQSQSTDAKFFVDPVPQMPFFMFVLASVLTLVLGHTASGFHRRAEEADEPERKEVDASQRMPLCSHAPKIVGVLITVGLPLLALLIVIAAFTKSFQMVESGALAIMLTEKDERVASYSLVDLGMQMTSGRSGDIGLRLVQFIFFSFSLSIPIALQCAFVALWLLPLDHATQLVLLDTCQALDAWAAFDVFAVAVTVSYFEFGLFSTFLMHYNNLQQGCSLVGEYLHDECFHMECSLTSGFAILAVAAVLSHAVPKLALRVCRAAMLVQSGASSNGSDNETDKLTACSDYDSDDTMAPL